MIQEEIAKGIGWGNLDCKIMDFRMKALQKVLDGYVPLLDWARPHLLKAGVPADDISAMIVFQVAEIVRRAGIYVGCHCLATIAECNKEEAYMDAIETIVVSECVDAIKVNDPDGPDMGLPPGFDPAKRVPDEDIEGLKSDPTRRRECLLNLEAFQHPIGWLELGGGGNFVASYAQEVEKDAMQRIIEVFKRLDTGGCGSISKDKLRQVFFCTDPPMAESDVDLLFAAADTKGDSKIDYEEFLGWLFKSNLAIS